MDNLKNLSNEELIVLIKRLDIQNTIVDFAINHHVDSKGFRLKFDSKFYHMKELYEEAMYSRTIVIPGGAQIGKSVWLLITTLAMAANGLNVFYVLPKNDMRDSYVQEKIQEPIKISTEYQKYLKESVSNKVSQIQFGSAFIKIVGGNSKGDMVSFPADALVFDETDKVETPSNLDLAQSRLTASDYKIRIFVSNPTDEKGYIWLWYEKSDKRVYKCPCDKCGKHSELDWFKSVVKEIKDEDGNTVNRVLRDTTWVQGSPEDIKIKCPEFGCDGNLVRDVSKLKDKELPYWEATAVSELGITGYHMPSLVSFSVEVRELWEEYKDALENPSKMETFYSMRIALPYTESGHKVSQGVLQRCVESGFKFELFKDCAYAYFSSPLEHKMGVDVASEHIDVSISVSEGERIRLVYVGKHSPANGLGFLNDLINRYNIDYAGIDAVPETGWAKNFQATAPCRVWRLNYLSSKDAQEMRVKEDEGLMELNRTETLDASYSKYKMKLVILPENYCDLLDGAFLKEMMALTRQVEETQKGFRNVWKGPAESDHARHADNYRNVLVDLYKDTSVKAEESIYIG